MYFFCRSTVKIYYVTNHIIQLQENVRNMWCYIHTYMYEWIVFLIHVENSIHCSQIVEYFTSKSSFLPLQYSRQPRGLLISNY